MSSEENSEGIIDGEGAGAGAGDNAGDSGATNDSSVDWGKLRDSLPEDLRGDAGLSTITSFENLAKGYVNIQKTMGNKIAVPDKHATEDDWRGIFNKLGNPEKIEDYNLSLGDQQYDENFLNEIKSAAHAAGILPWQLEKVLGKYNEVASGVMEASETEKKSQMEKDVSSLKKEWGEAFDDNKRRVNVALKELLPNEADRQRLIDDGLASHPSIVRALANASKFFKEDTFLGHGEGKLAGVSPEDAMKKANDIMGDMSHPYRNPSHPNHAAAQKEVQRLFEIAYPE